MEEKRKAQVGEFINHPNFGRGIILKVTSYNYVIRFEGFDAPKTIIAPKIENECELNLLKDKSFEDMLRDQDYKILFPRFYKEYDDPRYFKKMVLSVTSPLHNVFFAKIRSSRIYDVFVSYHNGILDVSCSCSSRKCEHEYALLNYLALGDYKLDTIPASKNYALIKNDLKNILDTFYLEDKFDKKHITSAIELAKLFAGLNHEEFIEFFQNNPIDLEKSAFVQKVFAANNAINNKIEFINTYEPDELVPFLTSVLTKNESYESGTREEFFHNVVNGYYHFEDEYLEDDEIMHYIAEDFANFEKQIYNIEAVYQYFAEHHLLKDAVSLLDESTQRYVYIAYYNLFKKEGTNNKEITTDDYFGFIKVSVLTSEKLDTLKLIFNQALNEGKECKIVEVLYDLASNQGERIYYKNDLLAIIKKLPDNALLLPTFKELLDDKPRFDY